MNYSLYFLRKDFNDICQVSQWKSEHIAMFHQNIIFKAYTISIPVLIKPLNGPSVKHTKTRVWHTNINVLIAQLDAS